MAEIVYSENALANLERAITFLSEKDKNAANDAVGKISSAIQTLEQNPLIGRKVASEIRELVISYGKSGYIALYRFIPEKDLVRILAIQHQFELDYLH